MKMNQLLSLYLKPLKKCESSLTTDLTVGEVINYITSPDISRIPYSSLTLEVDTEQDGGYSSRTFIHVHRTISGQEGVFGIKIHQCEKSACDHTFCKICGFTNMNQQTKGGGVANPATLYTHLSSMFRKTTEDQPEKRVHHLQKDGVSNQNSAKPSDPDKNSLAPSKVKKKKQKSDMSEYSKPSCLLEIYAEGKTRKLNLILDPTMEGFLTRAFDKIKEYPNNGIDGKTPNDSERNTNKRRSFCKSRTHRAGIITASGDTIPSSKRAVSHKRKTPKRRSSKDICQTKSSPAPPEISAESHREGSNKTIISHHPSKSDLPEDKQQSHKTKSPLLMKNAPGSCHSNCHCGCKTKATPTKQSSDHPTKNLATLFKQCCTSCQTSDHQVETKETHAPQKENSPKSALLHQRQISNDTIEEHSPKHALHKHINGREINPHHSPERTEKSDISVTHSQRNCKEVCQSECCCGCRDVGMGRVGPTSSYKHPLHKLPKSVSSNSDLNSDRLRRSTDSFHDTEQCGNNNCTCGCQQTRHENNVPSSAILGGSNRSQQIIEGESTSGSVQQHRIHSTKMATTETSSLRRLFSVCSKNSELKSKSEHFAGSSGDLENPNFEYWKCQKLVGNKKPSELSSVSAAVVIKLPRQTQPTMSHLNPRHDHDETTSIMSGSSKHLTGTFETCCPFLPRIIKCPPTRESASQLMATGTVACSDLGTIRNHSPTGMQASSGIHMETVKRDVKERSSKDRNGKVCKLFTRHDMLFFRHQPLPENKNEIFRKKSPPTLDLPEHLPKERGDQKHAATATESQSLLSHTPASHTSNKKRSHVTIRSASGLAREPERQNVAIESSRTDVPRHRHFNSIFIEHGAHHRKHTRTVPKIPSASNGHPPINKPCSCSGRTRAKGKKHFCNFLRRDSHKQHVPNGCAEVWTIQNNPQAVFRRATSHTGKDQIVFNKNDKFEKVENIKDDEKTFITFECKHCNGINILNSNITNVSYKNKTKIGKCCTGCRVETNHDNRKKIRCMKECPLNQKYKFNELGKRLSPLQQKEYENRNSRLRWSHEENQYMLFNRETNKAHKDGRNSLHGDSSHLTYSHVTKPLLYSSSSNDGSEISTQSERGFLGKELLFSHQSSNESQSREDIDEIEISQVHAGHTNVISNYRVIQPKFIKRHTNNYDSYKLLEDDSFSNKSLNYDRTTREKILRNRNRNDQRHNVLTTKNFNETANHESIRSSSLYRMIAEEDTKPSIPTKDNNRNNTEYNKVKTGGKRSMNGDKQKIYKSNNSHLNLPANSPPRPTFDDREKCIYVKPEPSIQDQSSDDLDIEYIPYINYLKSLQSFKTRVTSSKNITSELKDNKYKELIPNGKFMKRNERSPPSIIVPNNYLRPGRGFSDDGDKERKLLANIRTALRMQPQISRFSISSDSMGSEEYR